MDTLELKAQVELENKIEQYLDQLVVQLGQLQLNQNHKIFDLLLETQTIVSMNHALYQSYSPQYQFYICQGLLMEVELELNLLASFESIHSPVKNQTEEKLKQLKALFEKAIENLKNTSQKTQSMTGIFKYI